VLFTSVRCWGWEFVELYLHSPYIFTAWCMVKHRRT
jgi:hypothetical protein